MAESIRHTVMILAGLLFLVKACLGDGNGNRVDLTALGLCVLTASLIPW